MQSDEHNEAVSAEAMERKHENSNPSVGGILFVGAIVLLTMVACLWIGWIIMNRLAQDRAMDATAVTRGVITAPDLQTLERFPGPNLQLNPREDLVALRAREQARLTSYGWVNREEGVVHVPIERAMELLLEQGLPVRKSNAPPATGKSPLELIRERSQQP